MPIPKSTFCPIAPKPQTPVRDPDVIAVLTFTLSEIQEVTVPTTDVSTPVITKVSKKNNNQKTERASSVEEETGWDDTNTGLLISFLEDNFDIYKKNKSNFAKTAATKIFSGKSWEQIKNKLSHLVTKYNEIKEKENKTGRETQVKWKWFDRLDALFGTRENHNSGFLVDGFSDDVQLFDSFKEKETETNEEVLAEKKDNQITKKQKSLSQDPLAEAIISMSNARQIIWEKRLASENDQFEKKQVVEKEE
ncbi:1979_t:CDS:1 [Rhizophagus irregularis]|nr:1979_t:CDS:1 [Rhizophagus irregularis]